MREPHNKLLQAALGYATDAQHPLKVFPAPPGDKKSYYSKEYASDGARWGATDNPKLIKKYWHENPEANIGLPTGAVNGFFVVEVDTKEGHAKLTVDGQQSLDKLIADNGGEWPKTRTVRSPSGSLHYYFAQPIGFECKTSQSELGEGIDVLGDRAMVIAPPSVSPKKYPGKCYEVVDHSPIAAAPAWLLELVRDKLKSRKGNGKPHDDDALAPIEQLAAAMEVIPNDHAGVVWQYTNCAGDLDEETGFDGWCKIGMALYRASGGKDEGFAIFDAWSAKNKDKYDADNTHERWYKQFASSEPVQVGAGTIFMAADLAEPGWRHIYEQEHAEQPTPDSDDDDEPTPSPQEPPEPTGPDDEQPSSPPPKPQKIKPPKWRMKGKEIAHSMHNARLALTALGAECSHDLFHDKIELKHRGDDFHHELEPYLGEVSEYIIVRLRQVISDVFKFDPDDKAVRDAVISLAQEHRFNPVVDMLDKAEAEWDRVPRLDKAAVNYFNVEDTNSTAPPFAFISLQAFAAQDCRDANTTPCPCSKVRKAGINRQRCESWRSTTRIFPTLKSSDSTPRRCRNSLLRYGYTRTPNCRE